MSTLTGGTPLQMVFVVAVTENGVIGRDNAMPWRLKSDLRRRPDLMKKYRNHLMQRKKQCLTSTRL